jgi:hypothetical protein
MRLFRILQLLLGMAFVPAASAQHNHAGGHNVYKTWASKKTDNCCNNQDCGALREDEWRETVGGTEVKVSGQWCPVRFEHFLISGKSPDWSRAHACIQPDVKYSTGRKSPCERLLCFAGMPKF